jgi:hypothetical protein
MTDIVERLREYARNCGGPPEDYLTWQAANEIVRLRAKVKKYEDEQCAACRAYRETEARAVEPKP